MTSADTRTMPVGRLRAARTTPMTAETRPVLTSMPTMTPARGRLGVKRSLYVIAVKRSSTLGTRETRSRTRAVTLAQVRGCWDGGTAGG